MATFRQIVLFLFLAGLWLPDTDAQTGSGVAPLSKAQWREDLRYFAKELPKRHKNLYHATSREQFERAVAELDAAIPSLQDHQIIVRMHQIAAMVGDGHTGVHLSPSFKLYPLRLFWFDHELRVVAAGKEYQSALGTRVVKIGALGIDEVQARILSCFPSAENENEWYVMSTSPAFIVRPEVLHALGIVPDLGRAPFTFEDQQGHQLTLEISPDQKGHLFVVVGRQTFSAAMANAIDFRKETNAILVGEPIGERPNSYSENDEMTLPHSRLVVSYSTRYYKFLDEDVPAVMPDKRIDPNWADFHAGRDPVMDWILSYSPQ